ncbi:MAG: BrnA antitoxin family protein [Actinomycetes bacterium]
METKPLSDEAGEVRELTKEDLARFRPAAEVLPEELVAVLPKRKPGQRGAQKKPTKEPVTIRYSRDVLEYFRATGPGWQARIDAALKEWVAQHGQGGARR